jgi:SAM-dependent methyltransferase
MKSVREEREEIVPVLREIFRVWDHRAAEGYDNHGAESLIIQDAHRIAHTLAMLDGLKAQHRILEIGTGYLGLVVTLRRRFPEAQITGLEYPGRRYIWTQDYRMRLATEQIHLVATDIVRSGIPFRSKTFDLTILAEVIEHLPPHAIPALLAEVARTTASGGSLMLTTPNLASWTNRELLLRGDSPGQQSPALIIDGSYGHLRLYTMEELVRLVEAAGFQVIRRAFIDQIQLGISQVRRLIRMMLTPAKVVLPSLRDTCVILAVHNDS